MIHSVPDNTSLLSILFYYRFLPVNLQKYTTTYDTQKLQINLTYEGGGDLLSLLPFEQQQFKLFHLMPYFDLLKSQFPLPTTGSFLL